MRQFSINPHQSFEVLQQISKIKGAVVSNNLVEIESDQLTLKAKALELTKFIDVTLIEFICSEDTRLVREGTPAKDTILISISNFSTHGIKNNKLVINEKKNDYEIFVSNSIEKNSVDVKEGEQYKFITFRIHRDEFVKYQDIQKTDYMKVITSKEPFSLNHFVPKKMELLFEKIFSAEDHLGWHSLMQMSLVYELLADSVLLLRTSSPILHSEFDTYQLKLILDIQSYMVKNLQNHISIHDIHEHFNISESKLHKLFKKVVGSSPHNYLVNERLKKAKDLLVFSDQSIAEITYGLGFNSPSHFTTSFKNKFGITPALARKSSGLENKL